MAIIRGEAELRNYETVAIKASGEILQAKSIILATGSKPRCLHGIEPDGDIIITSREALQLTKVPETAVIVGAGPIGLEFAAIWHSYGCQVTILEAMPNVLPAEDEEISREAENNLAKAGIAICTNVRVLSMKRIGDKVEIAIATAAGQEIVAAEKVLMAIGTTPVTDGLGLEGLGLATTRGYLTVDDTMATNISGIFAIGDLNGKLPLAHTASAQGVVAAERIAGKSNPSLIYENIPRCVFGVVEVASVGLTERQARDRGLTIQVVKSPFLPNGKAVAIHENTGFIKLVADKAGLLVGVHMIGPHVTEMIGTAATMISLSISVDQAAQIIYPHPTLSEAFIEGIHALSGHAIHL